MHTILIIDSILNETRKVGLSKNEIIEKLFTGKNFNDCLSKMEPDYLRDDLRQEVALIVCEWPEERIKGLYERKELEFFVVRVILNQINSSTSPFFKRYRMPMVEFREVQHEEYVDNAPPMELVAEECSHDERLLREELEDYTIAEINKLYWYDAELIQLYMKHGNYRALEKETGIPYSSIFKTIQKSLKILREKATEAKPLFTKEERAFIQR